MDKNYFKGLTRYTYWADKQLIGWLEQINEEQWNRIATSSFGSIRETAIHIASAEKIWIDFWKNVEEPVYLSSGFTGSKKELIQIWTTASAGMLEFIDQFPEADYELMVTFRYPRGGEGRMKFWQSFAHIVNHSTYHRGQLVTLLRQAGFTRLSSLDLASYYLLQSE